MEIGKTLHLKNRKQWRSWLEKNHKKAREIWILSYRRHTGKKNLHYNDTVEEAICFGWIDSIVKKLDEDRLVQRWTPRRKGSPMSDLNKERARKMIKSGLMTQAGLDAISHEIRNGKLPAKLTIAKDIQSALKKDPEVWKNFTKFPIHYKRIRIGWIESSRIRPAEFRKRLEYFVKKTKQNKKFGMMQ